MRRLMSMASVQQLLAVADQKLSQQPATNSNDFKFGA